MSAPAADHAHVEGGVANAPRVKALPPPAIRVRHLWHRFGNIDVLRDVTFDVAQGEIFGFIGPNGAGKTTTIRVMATLLEPMAGRVEVDGIDVTIDPTEVRHRIGYMPDHAGVYERITVREYLEFFADAFRVPSLNVVDAVLELTDLGKIQDRVVATMSKGMKQRLQLGRILLHDPKVLVLDEPASDLDPRARIEIRDLLLELKSLGKTIFLSSHILTELSDVCTSIAILEKGRLVVAGPIGEISTRLEAIRAAQAVGHAAPPGVLYGPGYRPMAAPPYGAMPASPVMAYPAHGHAVQPAGPPQGAGPGVAAPGVAPGVAAAPVAQPVFVPQPTRRRLKVRVLSDPLRAAKMLQAGLGVPEVDVIGGVVQVGYTGGDAQIAEIVRYLVMNGAPVIGVEPERNELERIFLEVTRGEVQ
jgi:ABC-2 type transport system ATP-binding protein